MPKILWREREREERERERERESDEIVHTKCKIATKETNGIFVYEHWKFRSFLKNDKFLSQKTATTLQ